MILFLLTVATSMWTCVKSLRTGTFTVKSNKCHLSCESEPSQTRKSDLTEKSEMNNVGSGL